MPCPRLRRHLTLTNVGLLFTFLSIISSIVTIIIFAIKLNNLGDFNYLYAYQPAVCLPVGGFALNASCHETTKWISVWKLDSQKLLVENPFAFRPSRQEAIGDRSRIPLHNNISCVCLNPDTNGNSLKVPGIETCAFWVECISDGDFIAYLQRDNDRYINTYVSFIVASLIGLILSLVGLPATIKQQRRESYVEL